uniref:VWFA domain-containing protein n=1 Tax=Panagrellus redivivus TaxID=6233 RepID=A0A7E4UT85_PANRE
MKYSDLLVASFISSLVTVSNTSVQDGVSCANGSNVKAAWLDVVFVVELSTHTSSQWNSITGKILTIISQLPLSNMPSLSNTSRVAVIGYSSTFESKVLYSFADTQLLRNIQFVLNNARPTETSDKADIASGLRGAKKHLDTNKSFRVPSIVLVAATYDDSGAHNPNTAANELKANGYKLITISYDASNGVKTNSGRKKRNFIGVYSGGSAYRVLRRPWLLG